MKFYGIADCMGLDSFIPVEFNGEFFDQNPDPEIVSMLAMRARGNPQRHSVVYLVDLEIDDAKEISDLYDEGKYEEALLLMKSCANTVALAGTPGNKKMWAGIPNKKLNPF